MSHKCQNYTTVVFSPRRLQPLLFPHALTSPSANALPNSLAIPSLKSLTTSSPFAPFGKPFRQSHPLFASSTLPPLTSTAELSVLCPSTEPKSALPMSEYCEEAVVRFDVDLWRPGWEGLDEESCAAARVVARTSSHCVRIMEGAVVMSSMAERRE